MSELFEKLCASVEQRERPLFKLCMISDAYGTEGKRFIENNRCQDCYSVAKAFTVTALGLAYDKGLIKVTDKVCDILGDLVPEGIDERWYNITVEDALLHKIGMPGGFLDIDVCSPGAFGDDYLGFMLRHPFETDPCVKGVYTDGAYYLLSRVIEKVLGEPIDLALWKAVFLPMKFAEVAWSRCPQGHPMGATGLYIRTDDMVKLGELYRKGGVWNGQRLISEEWVNKVLEKGYEFHKTGVGDSYGKGGMNGQMLVVFPEKGLSIAWHGYNSKGKDDLLQIIDEYSIV